jgi:hypothetical protein
MKNTNKILVIPMMLWLANILVAVVEHLVVGPGRVIPTPLQKVVVMTFAPQMGLGNAHNLAGVVLAGAGLVSFLLFLIATRSGKPPECMERR